MKKLALGVLALMLPLSAQAQFGVATPIPVPAQKDGIPLLAGCADYSLEQWSSRGVEDRMAVNITCPTLTPVLPKKGTETGVAMIVAPGGAFHALSMDSEGYRVAHWLAARGIAAFVLKYRLIPAPRDNAGFSKAISAYIQNGLATQKFETPAEAQADGLAAIRLVRSKAADWRIDPARVGFVGFSAGAMTTLSVGLTEDKAARPDFIAPIYPPMVARDVPADAPPMFLAIALDDPLFAAGGRPLALIDSWRAAKRPLEVHLYEKGGHGFGMMGRMASSTLWIDEFYAWMKDRGLVKASR